MSSEIGLGILNHGRIGQGCSNCKWGKVKGIHLSAGALGMC